MLYPTTTIDLAQMAGMTRLEASSLLVIPLIVTPSGVLRCAMMQLSPTQDYSIRGWLSRLPGGLFLPTHASFWHFPRGYEQQIVIHDRALAVPDDPPGPGDQLGPYGQRLGGLGTRYPLAVSPGSYCLNILNLVNGGNIFSFSATTMQY
jgi:hypothetical protein